ncbi:MAG: RsmE family RNA methyltransferase [Fidelibacterota bacterium]
MTSESHHFVVRPEDIEGGDRFRLNGEEAHHLSRSARLKVGDEVFLLDGRGNARLGTIDRMEAGEVSGTILETLPQYHESAVRIHLGLGNLKGSRLTMVVEKGTELGIRSLTVLVMRYGVKKGVNLERLDRVALAAMKQCGRGRVPELTASQTYEEWCANLPPQQSMVTLDSPDSLTLREWLDGVESSVSDVWITVGPEGGYHPEERRLAAHRGIPFVSLGPRRLRSETAAIAAVAACETFFSGRG